MVATLSWNSTLVLLNNAQRRAVQAANDARHNMRHSPGSVTAEQLRDLDAAARAAQDAVTAHYLIKAR